MELSLVPKTQTIVCSQERCKIFEMIEGDPGKEEKYFTPTELDNKIEEFVVSVQDAGGAVVSMTFLSGHENIIAVLNWLDHEQVMKIQTRTPLTMPVQPGLKLK